MPNDPLKGLNTPNTGDLSGAWGTAAVNPNFTVVGGYLGGVQTVSLTNANVSLSISTGVIGTGSITPGAGPVQAANAVLKFSGTLTGNCDITFPCPGYWIVEITARLVRSMCDFVLPEPGILWGRRPVKRGMSIMTVRIASMSTWAVSASSWTCASRRRPHG